MNKKEAISYAQITLEIMLSSNCSQELNLKNFELKMNQVLDVYPKNVVVDIANGKLYAEEQLKILKTNI